MKKIIGMIVAAGVAAVGGSVSAATYDYNFKAAAEGGGAIGESAWTTFNTTTMAPANPNLTVNAYYTSNQTTHDGYVYFDSGNAGIGVCKSVYYGSRVNTISAGTAYSTANNCNPSNDDGFTTPYEWLTFTATSAMYVDQIKLNSNHDSTPITSSVWEINGVTYDLSGYTPDGSGDVTIDLGHFFLAAGATFMVTGTRNPDSYISALATSSVPLPAGAVLLVSGLAGLGVARRRRKA